jgi:ABC-type nitrate/sulfonate/bicarbonate transport system substrate-binding protein
VGQAQSEGSGEVSRPQIGIDLPIVELAAQRLSYGVKPVSEEVLAQQQKIADTFYELKLVPKQVRVSDAAWQAAEEEPPGRTRSPASLQNFGGIFKTP